MLGRLQWSARGRSKPERDSLYGLPVLRVDAGLDGFWDRGRLCRAGRGLLRQGVRQVLVPEDFDFWALLPGLADALGVTIDALFGREGGEKINIEDAAGRWLQGLPSKKRMEQLCRLIWSNVRYFLPDGLNMPEIGYLDTCQPVLDGSGDRLMISQCQGGGGILDPKGLATRAQTAQMLKNYLDG